MFYRALYDCQWGFDNSWIIKVTVKCYTALEMEIRSEYHEKVLQQLWDDIPRWQALDHSNLLPFLGTTDWPGPGFVVPYKMHGDLQVFLDKHPTADKMFLIRGIAQGLQHLHTRDPPIWHGCLKFSNIIIGDDLRPMLTEFGLSEVLALNDHGRMDKADLTMLTPEVAQATYNLSEVYQDLPRLPADVWRLGMILYEIIERRHPYHDKQLTFFLAARGIATGLLPTIPVEWTGLYDETGAPFVQITQDCWTRDPKQRPSMDTIVQKYFGSQETCDMQWKMKASIEVVSSSPGLPSDLPILQIHP